MAFKVINIIDANTIQVVPKWKWLDVYGDIVEIEEFLVVAKDEQFIIEKLKVLLLSQIVLLKNPKGNFDNLLRCSIYLNEINISFYFPEIESMNFPAANP